MTARILRLLLPVLDPATPLEGIGGGHALDVAKPVVDGLAKTRWWPGCNCGRSSYGHPISRVTFFHALKKQSDGKQKHKDEEDPGTAGATASQTTTSQVIRSVGRFKVFATTLWASLRGIFSPWTPDMLAIFASHCADDARYIKQCVRHLTSPVHFVVSDSIIPLSGEVSFLQGGPL